MSDFLTELGIELPPPPTGGTSGRRPLGVPSDYVAQRSPEPLSDEDYRRLGPFPGGRAEQFTSGRIVQPRYFVGMEWEPASLSAPQRAQIQAALVDAGLLDGEFQLGFWDDATRNAYADLLSFANASGLEETEALAEATRTFTAGGGKKKKVAPLTVQLTNPTDAAKVFDNVAKETIGRRLTSEEKARYVAAFQSTEQSAQTQAHSISQTGGTVTAPPDLSTFMEERLRAEMPADAQTMDTVRRGDEFFDLLRGSGEGVA